MGVLLGRGEVFVAQEFLDAPQVRAIIEQVRRKTVPQGVRSNLLAQARAPGGLATAFQTVLSDIGLSAPRWPAVLGNR